MMMSGWGRAGLTGLVLGCLLWSSTVLQAAESIEGEMTAPEYMSWLSAESNPHLPAEVGTGISMHTTRVEGSLFIIEFRVDAASVRKVADEDSVVSLSDDGVVEWVGRELGDEACNDPDPNPFLTYGGTLRMDFHDTRGGLKSSVLVSPEHCGN